MNWRKRFLPRKKPLQPEDVVAFKCVENGLIIGVDKLVHFKQAYPNLTLKELRLKDMADPHIKEEVEAAIGKMKELYEKKETTKIMPNDNKHAAGTIPETIQDAKEVGLGEKVNSEGTGA